MPLADVLTAVFASLVGCAGGGGEQIAASRAAVERLRRDHRDHGATDRALVDRDAR